jgi:hypothetical protein
VFRGGAVEIVKRGAARYNFSDPYHIAIETTERNALAFLGLEFGIHSPEGSLLMAADAQAGRRLDSQTANPSSLS